MVGWAGQLESEGGEFIILRKHGKVLCTCDAKSDLLSSCREDAASCRRKEDISGGTVFLYYNRLERVAEANNREQL